MLIKKITYKKACESIGYISELCCQVDVPQSILWCQWQLNRKLIIKKLWL